MSHTSNASAIPDQDYPLNHDVPDSMSYAEHGPHWYREDWNEFPHRCDEHLKREANLLPHFQSVIVADGQIASGQLLTGRLKSILKAQQFSVVSSIDEVLALARSGGPCLIISEVRLRGGSIVQLAERLAREQLPSRLLVYSTPVPQLILDRLRTLPVSAVISKSENIDAVIGQIEHVAKGGNFGLPLSQSEFVPAAGAEVPSQASTKDEAYSIIRQMTERQYAVLLLLAEGLSVKQVAHRLSVSVKTVDSLKYRLMKQLNFHDRVELTRFAIREGLVDP